MDRD
jgi:hypothetical protein